MEIKYNYADIRPDFITAQKNLGRNVYTLNFNIEELEDKGIENSNKIRYESATLNPGDADYGSAVSAIIRSRYSDDEMFAIINNYLDTPDDTKRVTEFKDMHEFRKQAKVIAKEFIAQL